MNQKDYKKIAGILNRNKKGLEPKYIVTEQFIEDLADYFEREDKDRFVEKQLGVYEEETKFNRQQFLRDCGVSQNG